MASAKTYLESQPRYHFIMKDQKSLAQAWTRVRVRATKVGSLPTRLGYVVRCSATEAVHKGGHMFLKIHSKLINLEFICWEKVKILTCYS